MGPFAASCFNRDCDAKHSCRANNPTVKPGTLARKSTHTGPLKLSNTSCGVRHSRDCRPFQRPHSLEVNKAGHTKEKTEKRRTQTSIEMNLLQLPSLGYRRANLSTLIGAIPGWLDSLRVARASQDAEVPNTSRTAVVLETDTSSRHSGVSTHHLSVFGDHARPWTLKIPVHDKVAPTTNNCSALISNSPPTSQP